MSGISTSELVGESSGQMLENQGFVKAEVKKEEKRNAGESSMYQERVA